MRFLIVALIIMLFMVPLISFCDEYNVQLDNIKFVDLVRVVYGDILKSNYVIDSALEDAPDLVSVNWHKMTDVQVKGLMNELAGVRGFDVASRFGALFIQRKSEEKKLDNDILIYKPLYRTSRYLSDIVASVTKARPVTDRAVRNPLSQAQVTNPAQDNASPNSAYGQLDKADSDQIVLSVPKADMEKVKKLLADIDTPLGEVLVHAAVYEVGASQTNGDAFQLAVNVLKNKPGVSIGSGLSGANTVSVISGGFDLILSALDQDSRFKTVTKPLIRVKSGSAASFSVGQSVPVLGQATLDKNGNPVQSVDYKPSGVILNISPDIHQNKIDLDISQQLSSFVATTTGVNNSPTLQNRSFSTKVSLVPGQVVVFAGLDQVQDNDSVSRFFGYKLGSGRNNSDSQILVLVEVEKI